MSADEGRTFGDRVEDAARYADYDGYSDLGPAERTVVASPVRRFLGSKYGQWTLVHTTWWSTTASFWLWWGFAVDGWQQQHAAWTTIVTVLAAVWSLVTALGIIGVWENDTEEDPLSLESVLTGQSCSEAAYHLLRDGLDAARKIRKVGSRATKRRMRREVRELRRLARLELKLRRNADTLRSGKIDQYLVDEVQAQVVKAHTELARLSVALTDLLDLEVADHAQRSELKAGVRAETGSRRAARKADREVRKAVTQAARLSGQDVSSERADRLREDVASKSAENEAYRQVARFSRER